MWRSTMSDGNALVSTDLDESSRAAAIAAMGYRLAAAGPRTRQRLLDRQATQAYVHKDRAIDISQSSTGGDFARGPLPLACDDTPAPDHISWQECVAYVRRIATLGSAAACGFGLVLLAQTPQAGKPHHETKHDVSAAQTVQAQNAAPAASSASPSEPQRPQQIADQDRPPPSAAPAQPTELAEPSKPQDQKPILVAAAPGDGNVVNAASAPAVSPVAANIRTATKVAVATRAPVAAKNAAAKTVAVKTVAPKTVPETVVASALAPMAHAQVRRAVLHAAPVVVAHAEPKPHVTHDVTIARFDLPHWLTEDQIPAPRALVMSVPPHALTVPAATAPKLATPPHSGTDTITVRPPPPPVPQRPVMIASSNYPPSWPYTRLPSRPYYGSPYSSPYSPYSPSPYGGYYGGAYGGGAPYGQPSGDPYGE